MRLWQREAFLCEQAGTIIAGQRCATEILDAHAGCTLALIIKQFGGFAREVNLAACHKGTTIIDAYDNRTTVFKIGHAGENGQRQCRMGSCDLLLIKGFAIGRFFAVELRAVPRTYARVIIIFVFFGIVPDAGNLIGLADLVMATDT